MFKEINELRNGIKRVVTSGKDPTQQSFQTEKKLKKSLELNVVRATGKAEAGKSEFTDILV